ncbi:MAG: CHAD domain-containing protein [Streptosporangiaceae bacterium]
MRTGPFEFVLDGPAAADPDTALAGLPASLTCSAGGRPQTVRRTWLDTFDWRLYRAGLTLEQARSAQSADLTLTGRDGEVVAAAPLPAGRGEPVRWPALLGALPAGPLAERLAPVVGIRALLPVARAVSQVTGQRVCNRDGKTVTRLELDAMTVSGPAAAAAPARLSVLPLRGYADRAARVAAALAAAPGVTPSTDPALVTVLHAAGIRPGDYSGKLDLQLSAAMPAAEAVAAVLAELLEMIEINVDGTVRDIDTEFLHDLRVAVRRTRSALKLAGDALPPGLAAGYAPEFKWLGDLTTPTRDLDVYLLDFPVMTARLAAASAADLRPLHDHLLRRRRAARRQLTAGLRSARFTGLTQNWREALAGVAAGRGKRSAAGRPGTPQLAADRIGRAHRRMLTAGAAITPASPPHQLHNLRKRGKELRYLLELFGSLYDQAEHWQAVRALKNLQDCLGEFQDTEVQLTELREFADQMMARRSAPAATLLAMGEIAAGLAHRQQAARSQFSERFRAFASPASRASIAALIRVPG